MAERTRQRYTPFRVGEKVWLDARNLSAPGPDKFKQKQMGPFSIEKTHGKLNYCLKLPEEWRIHPVFHAALLSRAYTTEAHGQTFSEPPPDLIDNEEEYQVEVILDHRTTGSRRKKTQYYVSWKGYSDEYNERVPEDNLGNAQEVIEEYKKRTGGQRKKPRRKTHRS